MGKTSLAITMARRIAHNGVPVGFVSLEMNEEEVTGTLTAQESGVDWDQFDDTNKPNEAQSRAMVSGAGRMKNLPIHFDYGKRKGTTVMMTPAAISAKARRWVSRLGVRIIFVDYLQRVEAPNKRSPREVQVAEISKAMKDLAQELQVPVVVLAQLNRDMEKDKSRKPKMSDLRESGAIEQDADFIGMLYAPTEDDLDMGNDPSIPIDVNMYIAKNRKGTRWVDVPFKFNRSITLFEEPTTKPF
jgi:replicative DNA helicase